MMCAHETALSNFDSSITSRVFHETDLSCSADNDFWDTVMTGQENRAIEHNKDTTTSVSYAYRKSRNAFDCASEESAILSIVKEAFVVKNSDGVSLSARIDIQLRVQTTNLMLY